MSAAVSALASENRMPVVTSHVARFFYRSRSMWSRGKTNSGGVNNTVSATRVCGKRRPIYRWS
jgi:hypothetical protein